MAEHICRDYLGRQRICRECAWWTRIEDEALEHGLCRFNPPHAEHNFPATFADDWCRHWASTRGWIEESMG